MPGRIPDPHHGVFRPEITGLRAKLPDALFPNVPVVFVAVNEMDVPQEITKFGVTGSYSGSTSGARWVS